MGADEERAKNSQDEAESSPKDEGQPKLVDRRRFFKIAVFVGILGSLSAILLGKYVAAPNNPISSARQRVVVDYLPEKYPATAGKTVNVNDLVSFPPNSNWVITYPSSGDPAADAQTPDTFRKFELVRLPVELGGGNPTAYSFVAFSKVCVHLECAPNYNPTQNINPQQNGYEPGPGYSGHQLFECPCHGSRYRLPDGLAIDGPSAHQPPPTNAVPMLTLSTDAQGYLWVEPPIFDVDHNGKLGYGRYLTA